MRRAIDPRLEREQFLKFKVKRCIVCNPALAIRQMNLSRMTRKRLARLGYFYHRCPSTGHEAVRMTVEPSPDVGVARTVRSTASWTVEIHRSLRSLGDTPSDPIPGQAKIEHDSNISLFSQALQRITRSLHPKYTSSQISIQYFSLTGVRRQSMKDQRA